MRKPTPTYIGSTCTYYITKQKYKTKNMFQTDFVDLFSEI